MRRPCRLKLLSAGIRGAPILIALALFLAGPSHSATSGSVVGATVPSATTLTDSCTDPAGRDFGTVALSTSNTTATGVGVCRLDFGSSNDTARLRIWSRGGAATAMTRATWITSALPTTQQMWRVDSPSPLVVWASGDNGTIHRSENAGATWSQQATGITDTIMGFDAVDDDVGWAATWAGTVLRTTDAGANWLPTGATGTVARLNHVAAVNASVAYVTVWGGQVLYTNDGGANWTIRNPPAPDPISDGIWAFDEDTVIVAGDGATILRSTNAGATWTSHARPFAGIVEDFEAVGDVVWASLANGRVMRSPDRGATWTGWTLPNTVTFEGIDARTPNDAAVAGVNGIVYVTTDAGATWRRQTNPLTGNDYRSVVWLDDLRLVVVGQGGSALRMVPATGPADFGAGGTWSSGTNAFGVCLQDAGLSAVAMAWTEDAAGATPGQCVPDDADPWNALPTTAVDIARTNIAGETGRVDLVWGFRVASNQPAGEYRAPLAFEVVAPAA